ncbi:hypothetical protein AUJ77_01750 [Candidatus Nomurabacteria bacterium CG1_02_43_90]|uniref:TNase-like domain-containing protein n=1 Tax=Candidatus Nomurabacteria bacterium CG1_02_43_90 TaxID=1805281 RepID=A0A1J4V0Z9_9BACT|nr:MAG: hypothetical protein AUJ77_01750 [Candidatus Nomurabacteria bacterium CG1_02_43_90]
MIKKILYAVGIVLGLFVLLVLVVPASPSAQPQAQQPIVEHSDIATTIPPLIATSTAPQVTKQTTAVKAVAVKTETPKPATTQSIQKYYPVTKVVDGDTVTINLDGTSETIRLIGINTPETVDPRKPVECFGKQASDEAKTILIGKKVRIEKDSTQGERDKYGRLLAYVFRDDGLFFNEHMIQQGYAYEYTYNKPYKYQTQFKADQVTAQSQGKGLWASGVCDSTVTTSSTSTSTTTTSPSGHIFYLSTYYSSKLYYCDTDDGWKSLSPNYLKSYSSEQSLLTAYPSRTLHEPCK